MLHDELLVAVPLRPNAQLNADEPVSQRGNYPRVLECLHAAGFTPVLTTLNTDLSGISAVVIPGGGDISPTLYGSEEDAATYGVNDEQDEIDLMLVAYATNRGLPILGICRGAQLINVARGGTLYVDLPPHSQPHHNNISTSAYPDVFVDHDVEIDIASRTAVAIVGRSSIHNAATDTVRIPVRSAHHQCVRELGKNLRPIAYSDDGLVEAFESTTDWVIAVQWHPEAENDDGEQKLGLFKALAAASRKVRDVVKA